MQIKNKKVHLSVNVVPSAIIILVSHDRHGVSKYQQLDCSPNGLFRLTTEDTWKFHITGMLWWVSTGDAHRRHNMETFSALLAICEENPPITGGFPSQRPVTRSSHAFFDLRLNKGLIKQARWRWFWTPSRLLWCHYNGMDSWIPMMRASNVGSVSIHDIIIEIKHIDLISYLIACHRLIWVMAIRFVLRPIDSIM